ncbi:MMPL family transporter [Gorillibacterium sp. CAU 1737]|uniref:MMPL family transporter n=1 Tax=Gorillibacterium sp. CAU 1737 TaxID=3140362 RepID=UPI0032604A2A
MDKENVESETHGHSALFGTLSRWVSGPVSRWVTVVVWIALIGTLTFVWPSVTKEENNAAQNLAANEPSVIAEQLAAREFPSGEGIPALVVWNREKGLSEKDIASIQQITQTLTDSPLPGQLSVPPYHKLPLPALQASLSPDGSTIVMPVLFQTGLESDQLKERLEQLTTTVKSTLAEDPFAASSRDPEQLNARITGPAGISVDATGLFKDADVSLLIATVVLVLVLLLLIYRSPVLALIPIIAVGFAYGLISPILGKLAQEGIIIVDSQSISIMTVLLFGAGTDYCLFLIARYRTYLTQEADKRKALILAVKGSGGAIAMSGMTVVLSLAALLLAKYGVYHRFAIPFSLSILIMGLASLTLVPALLAILGRASFFPVIPRTDEMRRERAARKGKPLKARKSGKLGGAVGTLVTKKPIAVTVLSLVLLGGLAAFTPGIKVTYDLLSSFPGDMPSREGFATLSDKFNPGSLAPVKVMIETEGKSTEVGDALAKLPYAAQVAEPKEGAKTPSILAYELELTLNPYSYEAMGHIPDIRQTAVDALSRAGVEGAERKVWISGQTAEQHDNEQVTDRDTLTVVPVIIALIALLLLVYLRSVIAMLYLILTVVLSFFSALGLGWLILHYGFGADAIQGAIPLYTFVFLVALGEDYNIFMVSSIWQKVRRGVPLHTAVREGVKETGSVITSAGIILAGTFAVLTNLPIQVLLQFGLITALGVLLDTFLVRPFLVPAITVLFGRLAFWPSRTGKLPGAASRGSHEVQG